MPARLPDLIRRARRLARERDRLLADLATEWSTALRGQGLSRRDLDELWGGLTEEAVRRLRTRLADGARSEALRLEAQEVIARVRERVEAELAAE
jgi:hypothetical protein